MGRPRIMPLGVTVYQPEKCYNGYTLFPASELGAMLIDMNGRLYGCGKTCRDFQTNYCRADRCWGIAENGMILSVIRIK